MVCTNAREVSSGLENSKGGRWWFEYMPCVGHSNPPHCVAPRPPAE